MLKLWNYAEGHNWRLSGRNKKTLLNEVEHYTECLNNKLKFHQGNKDMLVGCTDPELLEVYQNIVLTDKIQIGYFSTKIYRAKIELNQRFGFEFFKKEEKKVEVEEMEKDLYIINKNTLEVSYKGLDSNWIIKENTVEDMNNTITHLQSEEYNNNYTIEIIELIPIKCSTKIAFGKYESKDFFDEVEKRSLSVDIELTAENEEIAGEKFDNLIDLLEEKLSYYDVNFARCPSVETEKNKVRWCDGFTIDYNHGEMKIIKKEIMEIYKECKRKISV